MGDGNFAVVHRSKLRGSDREYAIKIVDKSKMKVKEIRSSKYPISNYLSFIIVGKRIYVGS